MLTKLLDACIALTQWHNLLWLLATLLCYWLALRLAKWGKQHTLLHPLSLTVLMITALMLVTDTSVMTYRHANSIIDWLLIPATAILAVPIFDQLQYLRRHWQRLLIPIIAGGIIGPLLATAWMAFNGADAALQATMATKSITSPLAMEASKVIGGWPDVAATLVIITGLIGALIGPLLFKIFHLHSETAQGIAYGTAAHVVGTARAFRVSPRAGAMGTVALCVNGILTAIILPILYLWL